MGYSSSSTCHRYCCDDKGRKVSNEERFELLWIHYHRQLDENREVQRALKEIRERLRELENEIKPGTNRPYKSS